MKIAERSPVRVMESGSDESSNYAHDYHIKLKRWRGR